MHAYWGIWSWICMDIRTTYWTIYKGLAETIPFSGCIQNADFKTSKQQQCQISFFTDPSTHSGYILTQLYGMSQQSLHEWVSTDQREKRRGNGRKNCSFSYPWHAISILYPHLSKSYLKHINFIFLGWMGLKGSPPNTAQWYWGWKERVEMIILPSCL